MGTLFQKALYLKKKFLLEFLWLFVCLLKTEIKQEN